MRKESNFWLYHFNELSSIFKFFDAKLEEHKALQVKIIPLLSKMDLVEQISKWKPYKFKVELETKENKNIFTIKLEKIIKEKPIRGNAFLIRHEKPYFYYLLTNENMSFIRKCLIPFFQSYYPTISLVFLTSVQIKDLLEYMEKLLGAKIITDRVVAKRYYAGKETSVEFKKSDYKEAFLKSAEDKRWIDKIEFKVIRDKEIIFAGFLSRCGIFKCWNGKFSIFYQTIDSKVSNIALQKLEFFDNRERKEERNYNSRPIQINYEQDIFIDKSLLNDLIEAIRGIKYSSSTILHRNPYLHISITDHLDGSSYDLWVTDMNRIIIIPQIRATFSSFARFCNQIFERFREGKVEDYTGE
jgi:hypothetical protein